MELDERADSGTLFPQSRVESEIDGPAAIAVQDSECTAHLSSPNQQSTIVNQQSSINNRQSTIVNPSSPAPADRTVASLYDRRMPMRRPFFVFTSTSCLGLPDRRPQIDVHSPTLHISNQYSSIVNQTQGHPLD